MRPRTRRLGFALPLLFAPALALAAGAPTPLTPGLNANEFLYVH